MIERGSKPSVAARSAEIANNFGLGAALAGFAAAIICSAIAVSIFATESGHPRHPSTFGTTVAGLIGLWIGLVGSAIVASRSRSSASSLLERLRRDFGFEIRPTRDVPLGIVVGIAAQYLLEPLLELPLLPFVPHLSHRLAEPAHTLTGGTTGAGLAVLGVLVCVGSPVVEELFFRGLLLRGLLGRLRSLPRGGTALSLLVCGIAFGLAHFEALQLLGLIGFGVVLSFLAWRRTGRLGPGIVAHLTFNATTIIAIAFGH